MVNSLPNHVNKIQILFFLAKYSPWSGWTDCTKPCGGGTKNRTRECISTVKNGRRCNDGANIEIMNTTCNVHSCSSAQSGMFVFIHRICVNIARSMVGGGEKHF